MKREEIERIFINAGWRKTLGAPANVIDYQTSKPFYNRIIIYPMDFEKVTEEALKELMSLPIESAKRYDVRSKYGF